ncbi:MAG: hypothetical protein PVF83_03745 [Anaerolineales bacterium]|jgi:hypothetical protein
MTKRKVVLFSVIGILSLCILAAGISALSNLGLPEKPESRDTFSFIDKARLAETLHLKEALGEEVWPGWGQMEIPVMLWTEETSFLFGFPVQPTGWETVTGDTFNEQAYYKLETEDHNNFAILVDDRWTASMGTKWETDHFLVSQFQEMLPSPIDKIIPYRIFIQPSEVQMTGVLHETFHVYQAISAPDKLEKAEERYGTEEEYWEADEYMGDDWREEIALLIKALDAETDDELTELTAQFLEQRQTRRETHGMKGDLIEFERLLEWEEGLAKYVEIAIWKQAFSSSQYNAIPDITQDPDFKGYETFEKRWQQEIATMKNQAAHKGDVRFYYTGMAQAFLLDRLIPGWKNRIMADHVWLDDLLIEAVGNE